MHVRSRLVLLNSADLGRPGAWKRPRHLFGIGLMAVAAALLAMKIIIDASARSVGMM